VNNKGRGKDEEERRRKESKEIIIITIPLNIKNSIGKEWLGN
jgi:hypothetical protein